MTAFVVVHTRQSFTHARPFSKPNLLFHSIRNLCLLEILQDGESVHLFGELLYLDALTRPVPSSCCGMYSLCFRTLLR